MKKLTNKLQLKAHTVRTLQVSELEQVNGGQAGLITYRCSEVATTCNVNFAPDAGAPQR
jgi:hypothetical protein